MSAAACGHRGQSRVDWRPVEPEPQHEVGIQQQPALLIGNEVGAGDRTDDGQGRRQVEVVVDRVDEAGVEPPAHVAQRSRRVVGPVGERRRPADPAAVPRDALGDAVGRGPASGATRAGGTTHGPLAGAGPSAATRSRSEASPAAAAVTLAREYESLWR